MNPRTYVTVVIALFAASICRATLEFYAYIDTGKEVKFVITDVDDGKASGWIVLGQRFKDYTLVAFDAKKELLSVRSGDVTIELPLKSSRVNAVKADPPELEAARKELARLRTRYFDKHPLVVNQLKKIAELEARSSK